MNPIGKRYTAQLTFWFITRGSAKHFRVGVNHRILTKICPTRSQENLQDFAERTARNIDYFGVAA